MNSCPSCGCAVAPDQVYCAECGFDLGPSVRGVTRAASNAPHTDSASPAAALPSQLTNGVRPGKLLWNRYRVEAEIGSGGMGTVYRAVDPSLEQGALAVKILSADLHGLADAQTRLRLEVAAARTLDHPNILRVFEFHDEEPVGIVMELLQGTTLRAHLGGAIAGSLFAAAPSRQRSEAAAAVAAQLASALDHIHANHLVHRDIKPSNVMLCPTANPGDGAFRVKLLDFGLVRAVQGSGMSGLLQPGTAAFLAPELQERSQAPSPASDTYALGKLLYLLLTGKMPSHRTPDPSRLVPGLKRKVDVALMACLDPDPRQRPSSAGAAVEPLCAQFPGTAMAAARPVPHPVSVTPSPPGKAATREATPRPTATVAPGDGATPGPSSRAAAPARKRGNAAALLNLVFLGGAGYLHLGQGAKGVLTILLASVLWSVGLGWIVHIVAAIDAVQLVDRINKGRRLRPWEFGLGPLQALSRGLGLDRQD